MLRGCIVRGAVATVEKVDGCACTCVANVTMRSAM